MSDFITPAKVNFTVQSIVSIRFVCNNNIYYSNLKFYEIKNNSLVRHRSNGFPKRIIINVHG